MSALSEPIDDVTERILRARGKLNHTQTEAADTVGVCLRTWQRIEHAETKGSRNRRMLSVVNHYLGLAGVALVRIPTPRRPRKVPLLMQSPYL